MSAAPVSSALRLIHPMSRIRRPLCATHTAKRMNRRPTATLIDPTTGAAVGVRTSATAAGARTASPKTAKTTTRSRPQPWAGRRRSSTPRTSGRSSTGAGISAALLSGASAGTTVDWSRTLPSRPRPLLNRLLPRRRPGFERPRRQHSGRRRRGSGRGVGRCRCVHHGSGGASGAERAGGCLTGAGDAFGPLPALEHLRSALRGTGVGPPVSWDFFGVDADPGPSSAPADAWETGTGANSASGADIRSRR